ncbi:hypothetical protein E8E15_005837 [Penicillium rubens]|uniref:Pc20g09540 protein n=2 Tax=Penicillium chrysogenum species complex TaxID=254878 RepID=B6HFB2_PENRW|nr:hypothetical protein E8E15_005837 [Penicillium rubens]KZN86775.1 hypothetical protein EN45_053240 [Penicillium chrysogenum]CAP86283.1 Pc20g09540 [Penicillium rubens Wisconsin 54-1255]
MSPPPEESHHDDLKIPDSEAAYESVHDRLDIQDVPRNSRLASQPSETEIADATADVIAYLEANMTFLCEGTSRTPLSEQLGWAEIDYEEFTGGNGGLLSSTPGRYKGATFPGWDLQSLQEWWTKDSWDADVLAGPSTQLVITTDGIGMEERLLLSELGAIVQVIMFRRIQPEFRDWHIFPVLMLSFFGPRHGRILQACYDSYSEQLELCISPIFNFLEKDNESFDLFLRFMASSPPETMGLDLSEISLES